ncbi:hypothetical protein TorRG33x02_349260, partial [Trema orientale]
DENNEERLESTIMDIKKTSSTIPQMQLAESLDINCPDVPLEAWIVHSEITKAVRGEAMEDKHYSSYIHGRKPNFKKLWKKFLRTLPSIQKSPILKHKPLPSQY